MIHAAQNPKIGVVVFLRYRVDHAELLSDGREATRLGAASHAHAVAHAHAVWHGYGKCADTFPATSAYTSRCPII
jgi:hypothetical protein